MDIFQAAADALTVVFSGERLWFILLGTLIGLLLGILPGIGGIVGVSLLLPFLYGMDPISGVGLLIGLMAVGGTSDTFPAVLIGVPGSGGSQAVVVDGYPLARSGQADRALGVAFTSSLIGGLLGAVSLFGLIFIGRPLILAFATPELFMLCLLGLSMVAVLSRGATLPGALSGLLGLLLGMIGTAPTAAQYRYVFDTFYLRQGISLTIIALSIFAIPEILQLMMEGSSVSRTGRLTGGGILKGMREAFSHKALILRSSLIGTGVGVIPGLGGSVVDWITYGIAKQTSKKDNRFGKGDIRGVIAPEAANNAIEGGTLVPTLFFGIPGSGTTAVILAGFFIMGIPVGPSMLERHLDITLATVWTLAIANVMAVAICLLLAKQIAKVSVVPGRQLAPFLLVLMMGAAYQHTQRLGDIVLMLALGFLGYVMKQAGFPRPPMIIGFVLAISTERYLQISMSRYGMDWISRPWVILIAVAIVGLVFGSAVRDLARSLASREAEGKAGSGSQ